MLNQYSEAKLIFISYEQKQKLLEIKEEVTGVGGDTSLNQLIRDAIDIMVENYQNEIIKKNTPIRLRDLINKY